MKIAVAGSGYVGLSLGVLLSLQNEVTIVDILPSKVDKINNGLSPIQDEYIEYYLKSKQLSIKATLDSKAAYIAKQLIKKRNWSLLPHLQITTVELIILIHSMLKQLSKRY
ncbi:UDP-glucose 6-dehydrogenase [Streptococcus pyogenes ABC020044203]|nr:UDP-glucose 6-dehydrogenase [Streptococcus pyogenes ABC020044203]